MSINNLTKAIEIACTAHMNQVDKAGQPYILHPLRLMMKFNTDEERIVAVLHDVVEDSDFTLDDLRRAGFTDSVVDAVNCVSKQGNEPYADFITRISLNELATKIKIQDIKDNLDVTRLESITDVDLQRIAKYHKAIKTLQG